MTNEPRALWTRAVRLGAEGRYDEAWQALHQLAGTAQQSLALSTRGSHLRQIGAVDDARALDQEALDCAPDAEARADALIGLAADEVAAGRSGDAELKHAQACAQDWRTQTRLLWVTAEEALLCGDAEAALRAARRAVDRAEGHSSRHAAKGRIIAAAAQRALGVQATVDLVKVAQALRTYRIATLQWPLALVAADLCEAGLAGPELPPALPRLLVEGTVAVSFIGEHLPSDRAAAWRARHDLVRLTRP